MKLFCITKRFFIHWMMKLFLYHKKIINSLDGKIIFASQKKIHKYIGDEIIFVSQKKLIRHCTTLKLVLYY